MLWINCLFLLIFRWILYFKIITSLYQSCFYLTNNWSPITGNTITFWYKNCVNRWLLALWGNFRGFFNLFLSDSFINLFLCHMLLTNTKCLVLAFLFRLDWYVFFSPDINFLLFLKLSIRWLNLFLRQIFDKISL